MTRLRCCCCGGTAFGQQHWNRDTGHGICSRCAREESKRSTPEEMESRYGKEGRNYYLTEPCTDRDVLVDHLATIGMRVGEHLGQQAIALFDKLTDDEKNMFSKGNITSPFYIAKLLTCCVLDTVEPQFAAESMKPLMRKVKKIRLTRP